MFVFPTHCNESWCLLLFKPKPCQSTGLGHTPVGLAHVDCWHVLPLHSWSSCRCLPWQQVSSVSWFKTGVCSIFSQCFIMVVSNGVSSSSLELWTYIDHQTSLSCPNHPPKQHPPFTMFSPCHNDQTSVDLTCGRLAAASELAETCERKDGKKENFVQFEWCGRWDRLYRTTCLGWVLLSTETWCNLMMWSCFIWSRFDESQLRLWNYVMTYLSRLISPMSLCLGCTCLDSTMRGLQISHEGQVLRDHNSWHCR